MAVWYRVFSAGDTLPEPAGLARLAGSSEAPRVAADAGGWYRAEIPVGAGEPLVVERWLADEEGIRGELNSWAGFVESLGDSPQHHALMERAIQARQLFTLERPAGHPDEGVVDRLCVEVCRHLAGQTDGFYQVDDAGFFAADGTLLVRES